MEALESDLVDLRPALPSLGDVMQQVEREMLQLGQLADRMQAVISPLLCSASVDERDRLSEAQGLDLLAQHLYGLAYFLGALAPTLPRNWSADASEAARVVVLSDLSDRLALRESCIENRQLAGHCDLFDD